MFDIFIRWLLLFITRMFRVLDPTDVKTVSNKTESCEKRILALESVINLSFLHETRLSTKTTTTVNFKSLSIIF